MVQGWESWNGNVSKGRNVRGAIGTVLFLWLRGWVRLLSLVLSLILVGRRLLILRRFGRVADVVLQGAADSSLSGQSCAFDGDIVVTSGLSGGKKVLSAMLLSGSLPGLSDDVVAGHLVLAKNTAATSDCRTVTFRGSVILVGDSVTFVVVCGLLVVLEEVLAIDTLFVFL